MDWWRAGAGAMLAQLDPFPRPAAGERERGAPGKNAWRVTAGEGQVLPRAQFRRLVLAALRQALGDCGGLVRGAAPDLWGEV